MTTTLAHEASAQSLRALAGASVEARSLRVDGVDLAYDDRGSGPVIVGLHATGHGSGDFELVAESLATGHRLITLDWPGHGRSGEDREPFSARRCAQLIAGFLDALELDGVTLIGCSIGAAAALIAARDRTGQISAIVACDPGGLAPVDPIARTFCRAMGALGDAGERRAWWFEPCFALFCRLVLQTPDSKPQRARIVAGGAECGRSIAQAWRSFIDPAADITAIGPEVAQPVLFAWASHDSFVAFGRSRAAVERFPRATVRMFDAGHCAFLERPEAFLAAFAQFEAATKS